MFIELTDHLRCTAEHAEQFLVLLPGEMAGRRVVAGTLGCPVCGRAVAIAAGVAEFGGEPPPPGATGLTAEAIATLIGLEGPGGYLALFGGAAGLAPEITAVLPGIRLALVNPPAPTAPTELASVLRGGRSPIKERSMRAAVVAADHATPEWIAAAIAAVLPGNRVVVEGPPPGSGVPVEILAESEGLWVGRKPGAARR